MTPLHAFREVDLRGRLIVKTPEEAALESAADALLAARPEPPGPAEVARDPDDAPAPPKRRNAFDGLAYPPTGKSRLTQAHRVAWAVFTEDAGEDREPKSNMGAQLDASAERLGLDPLRRARRAGSRKARKLQIYACREALRLPAILPGEQPEAKERERIRLKRGGPLNRLTARPTARQPHQLGGPNLDEVNPQIARAWRRTKLPRVIGRDHLELLEAVRNGATIRGLASRGWNQRQATNRLMRALDALVFSYATIDDAFAAKIAGG